jgi:cytochrome c-type biogenesis protein CcmE
MNHKMRVAFGVTVLAVFGTMAFLNFNKTVAPYVPFAEAKTAARAVQVAGFPNHEAARFDPNRKEFQFTLSDDQGEVMPVIFTGVKPGNFDEAEKVVVIGTYKGEAFHANQILVKCPSKYDDMSSDKLKKDAAASDPKGAASDQNGATPQKSY